MEPSISTAREANHPEKWNSIWELEGTSSWRGHALAGVYQRIVDLVPRGSQVADFGGGIGLLGQQLKEQRDCSVSILDHSESAVRAAQAAGLEAYLFDIEDFTFYLPRHYNVFVATEVLEHLSQEARDRLLWVAANSGKGFFSVPNNRLGPEEEPQHTIKFTAKSFKTELERFFKDVRVECIDGYLLGICGFSKKFKLSFTMPVRDEAADIERTLASFRGVADEMVIGIDPRTTDSTWKICERYADHVFFLESPEGPEGDRVNEGGAHFSWLRNQCIERCTGDWIFMCEGHEPLVEGRDILLSLDQLPTSAMVAYVRRSGGPKGQRQQWFFPWLFRNNPKIRFKRSTHNIVDHPESFQIVALPGIRTLHERDHAREKQRDVQRKAQNRMVLMADWLRNQNENSLYYLAAEWRELDPDRAIRYFKELLALPKKNGPQRYQTRLILAKMLAQQENFQEAKEVLFDAVRDDWSRTDHWVWLGDLFFHEGKSEEALQFYRYGCTRLGDPPLTAWWIDLSYYSWLPAQRMAMVLGEMGSLEEALIWAKRVLAFYAQEEVPVEMIDEAKQNISILEEALNGRVD